MSRALTIAREDLRHAIRDRLLWGAAVLLGLMLLPSTANVALSRGRPPSEFIPSIALDLVTFTLVVVAAVGYGAVVGERESGTIRLALGLPGTRRDLVVGKLLARSAVVVVVLTAMLAVADGLFLVGYGDPYLVQFWTMAGWMLVYGVGWTAVTVGYSAAFTSRYRVVGALVATYGVFGPTANLWDRLVEPAVSLLVTGSTATPGTETTGPLWFRFLDRLNPLEGFFDAMHWSVRAVGPREPTTGVALPLVGTVAFLAFAAVPLLVGYRRFARADLTDGGSGSIVRGQRWRSLQGVVTGGRFDLRARDATGPSRVRTIAREDARHALQRWTVVGAVGLLAVFVVPDLWSGLETSTATTAREAVADITLTFLLPTLVLAVAVGHRAVVGERESGTVRLALGLPGTRRDLVGGKLLARVGLTVVALLPLLIFAEALVVVRFGDPYLAGFLAWASYLLLFGVTWTAVVVGVSAAVASRYRALATVLGTYLLFSPSNIGAWDVLVRPLFSLPFTGRFAPPEGVEAVNVLGPLWFRYLDHLNPFVALQRVQEFLLGSAGLVPLYGTPPLYAYSTVVVVLFAIGTVTLGYRRFARADLG